MELIKQINADFMTAFKAKEMEKKNFLGVIKGEVQAQQGRGVEATDENVLKVIKKIEKSLKEVDTDESKRELSYLEPYLPKMLSEVETKKLLDEFVSTQESVNIGSIMKYFNSNYKGVVDNKIVQTLAKQL